MWRPRLPEGPLDRIFWGLFLIFSAAFLVPLWSVPIPPMQDIWQHLALVDVLHHYHDPGSVYPEYFRLPTTPRPNLIYYYGTHWLATLTGDLLVANRLVLSLYVLAFPWAFLSLARAFDRSRWTVFFAFPLIYNAMFAYGFVSFALAMPLLFWAVAAFRRFAAPDRESPDWRAGAWAALFILLLFFTHAHLYLLANLLCLLLWGMHRGRCLWGFAARAAPLLPALVFFLPWFLVFFVQGTPSSSGMAFGTLDKFFGPTFYKPGEILSGWFFHVGDYFKAQRDDALFLALLMVAMVLLVVRRAADVPRTETRKVRWFDLEVLTVVLALSTMLLPQHIEAQSVVSMRHAVFAFLLFFAWLRPDQGPRRIVVPAMVVLWVLNGLFVWNLVKGFQDFRKELEDYPALFDRAEEGKRLLKVAWNQESRVIQHGAFWHLHFLYAILRHGVADFEFSERPHNPIQYRQGMIPPKPGVEFPKSPVWRYFDYILVRKSSSPPLRDAEAALDPLAETSDWILYRVSESPLPRPPATLPLVQRRNPAVSLKADHDTSAETTGGEDETPTFHRASGRPSVLDLLRWELPRRK